jgi:ferredoxin
MPTLTVEGFPSVEVPSDKRLVLAVEQDAGVDILHACGGNARCTTCRVVFVSGEPTRMTTAEKMKLEEKGLQGMRLSDRVRPRHDGARHQPPRRQRPAGPRQDAGTDDPAAARVDRELAAAALEIRS